MCVHTYVRSKEVLGTAFVGLSGGEGESAGVARQHWHGFTNKVDIKIVSGCHVVSSTMKLSAGGISHMHLHPPHSPTKR